MAVGEAVGGAGREAGGAAGGAAKSFGAKTFVGVARRVQCFLVSS